MRNLATLHYLPPSLLPSSSNFFKYFLVFTSSVGGSLFRSELLEFKLPLFTYLLISCVILKKIFCLSKL